MEVKKVVIVGAGSMGHGITQILSMANFEVAMVDINDEFLQKGLEKIKWSLNKYVDKRRIRSEDAEAALSRITTTTDYAKAGENADFAVEAVSENLDLKKKIFTKLDVVTPAHAVLTSNTSTLSITEMGLATNRPDKVAGMHFFNPPQIMQLIEVVKGETTSDETLNSITDVAKKLRKTPVVVKKDVRGFIVNRILGSVFNEAFWTLKRGETTKEGLDASVKYTGGFPMGFFELADYVGLDIAYEVGNVLYNAYGERFKPCAEIIDPLIKEKNFGQKTGVGFYNWTKGRPRIPFNLLDEYDVDRSWAMAVNEAAWLIEDEAATPHDIDTGMKLGTGWPSGPCEYADRTGIDILLSKLKNLYGKYQMEMYKPCSLLEKYVEKGWTGRKVNRGFYK